MRLSHSSKMTHSSIPRKSLRDERDEKHHYHVICLFPDHPTYHFVLLHHACAKIDSTMSKAHDDTTSRDGSPAIAKNSGNESDDDEDNSKPPAQQQPQEAPAQDNTSASREHNPSQMEVKLDSLTPSDKEMFIAADARRRENERNVISTHAHLLKVKSESVKSRPN